MAGKYGFSGRMDESANWTDEQADKVAKQQLADAALAISKGEQVITPRAVDPSVMTALVNEPRANMEEAYKNPLRPPNRKVVKDDEGKKIYSRIDNKGKAEAIAFAAQMAANSATRNQSAISPSAMGINDPLVRNAIMETGFDPNMNFTDKYKFSTPPGPILEASKGTWMDEAQQSEEVARLIQEGTIPVTAADGSAPVGVPKKLTTNEFGRGFKQRRNSYDVATHQDVDSVMKKMWSDTRELQGFLMQGFQKGDADSEKLIDVFSRYAGSIDALQNEQFYFGLVLAYYRALQEARFADHSVEQKSKFTRYSEERGNLNETTNEWETYPVDPELYTSEGGRRAESPRKKVLYERMGDYIEAVTRAEFDSAVDKQIVGNAVLGLIEANGNIKSHTGALRGYNPEQGFDVFRAEEQDLSNINDQFELIDNGKVWKLVEDIQIDKGLSEFLALSQGVRDLLQPNFRKHVRVVPKSEQDARNIYATLVGKRSSGTSPIRQNYKEITESFPMMLNPLGVNLMRSLYTLSEQDNNMADYLNYGLSIKPEQFQMILQEDEWIRQNSPDGKTWYQDIKDRSSGRQGHATNMMSDMKPMRALTIPRFASFIFKTPTGKKLNEDEKTFLYTVMGLTGYADHVPEAIDRKIEQIMNDGNHPWRRLGAALNMVAHEGVLPPKEGVEGLGNNPAYITVKMLEDSKAVKEGLHSLEALRALDNYLKAKENPQMNEFSTKLIGEIDAAQSGPTIQASMIGNWHGLYAGGLPMSEVWWKKRKEDNRADSRFALPKLYQATSKTAQEKIEGIIKADNDKDFIQLVKFLFADDNHDLSELWERSVGFAKTGLVGASYGQGKAGSVISITEEIKKHFEETLSPKETNDLIQRMNKSDAFRGQISIDEYSYRLVFSKNAYKQLNALAKIYTDSMYESDNNVYEYAKNMREAFKISVLFADFAQKDRLYAAQEQRSPYVNFKPPQMIYKEPQDLDSVYTKPWVDGMTKSMLDEHVPDEWKSINVLETNIPYQAGVPQPNVAREVTALDFDNDEGIRSKAISRMPVISIHGLDDLIQSITVNELWRKYGPEGTVQANKMNYFVSVWDAGLIEPQMRKHYMEEYNKAFAAVMKNNKFFSQLTRGWEDAIYGIDPSDIQDPTQKKKFSELKNRINKMRAVTNDFYKGSSSYTPEDKKRGIKEADEAMEERSIFQTYVPEAYDELMAGILSASSSPSALNQGVPLDSKNTFADFLANRK